jgi:osmotically-inducible protein OsmY
MRQYRTDETLQQSVRRRLDRDHRLAKARVDVDVDDGVVRLRGTVPDELDRALALYDALDVAGVTRVINDLRVSEPPPRGRGK